MKLSIKQMLLPLLLLLTLAPFATAQNGAQNGPLAGFDDYVNNSLKQFEVPGVAVAIVKDNQVVLAKGYGVRKLGEATAVDEHTLFGIASCSKAFTAAALAMLVDEGKIKWDDPVTKYLPGFQLYDPYVTRELTIRDLLCHRSGLPLGGGDLLWYASTYTPVEVIDHIRYLKPNSSLRSKYAYQNVMFIVAGQLIPAITGQSWREFIRARIFTPLAMLASTTSVSEFEANANVATPHSKIDGRLQPITLRNWDGISSAGAINSNVLDMAQWIKLQLNEGKWNGKAIYSTTVAQEMWAQQTIIPINPPRAQLQALKPNFSAYGLGWVLRDYHGKKIVFHTGGLDGMTSVVGLMPEEHLGVVVLTNQEEPIYYALLYQIFDAYLGLPNQDWTSKLVSVRHEVEAQGKAAEEKLLSSRVADSKPSLPLTGYVGSYQDPIYGEVKLAVENDKLVVRFSHSPTFVGDLEHWQYDTFLVKWRDRVIPNALMTFTLSPTGQSTEMKLMPVSPLADFSFDFEDYNFKRVAK